MIIFDKVNALVNNQYFLIFLLLVLLDYLTGVCKATVWKVTDSDASIKGIIRHTLVIISVAFVWLFSEMFNAEYIAFTLTIMYSLNYLLSIMENFGVMGVYVPEFLKNKVQAEINRYEKQLENSLDNKDIRKIDSKSDLNINIINEQDKEKQDKQ